MPSDKNSFFGTGKLAVKSRIDNKGFKRKKTPFDIAVVCYWNNRMQTNNYINTDFANYTSQLEY